MSPKAKKEHPAIRADDAMARFDRLLATMAPKAEPKHTSAKARKKRGPKARKLTP